jgi:hypothetical protein
LNGCILAQIRTKKMRQKLNVRGPGDNKVPTLHPHSPAKATKSRLSDVSDVSRTCPQHQA